MSGKSGRLWDKGGDLDALLHQFTVGNDPELDRALVHWDCLGSAAHARGLHRIGILSDDDIRALIVGLREIDELDCAGAFRIPPELEDCHTAIEAHLTTTRGEVGQRIHAGRSRNDQIATAMRLYLRRQTLDRLSTLDALIDTCLKRCERDGDMPLPGYTHLQPAMPSSVGQWLQAWIEWGIESTRAGLELLDRLDSCPLGTGAGFGVPLPLDRSFVAKALGFSRVQRNPIDVQNSRGRMELHFVRWCIDVGSLVEKVAWDLQLFATREFGIVTLPENMTTGSSLMPQKRNPDVLELMRGRAARMRGIGNELEWVVGKLPSSYHRDLQLTKEPPMRAAEDADILLRVAARVIEAVEFNRERIVAAMPPELFATAATLQRVLAGDPFRKAYRNVANEVTTGAFKPVGADESIGPRTLPDAQREIRGELAALSRRRATVTARIDAAESALLVKSR